MAAFARPSTVSIALVLAVGLTVAACTRGPASSAPDVPSVEPSPVAAAPTATPVPSPTPWPTVPPEATPIPRPDGLTEEQWQWTYSRWQFGLPYDRATTVGAAEDPAAEMALDFPMRPAEAQEWWSWQATQDRLVGPHVRYGAAHPDEFGGLFIDQRGRQVATLWTGNLDGHEAALRRLVGEDAPLVLYQVRYPEAELRRLQDLVPWEHPVFSEVPADLYGAGVDLKRNAVSLDVSSANPDAPRLIGEAIAAALGVTPDMVVVDSDGTGVNLIPWGTVKGVVYLPNGERLRGPYGLDVFGSGEFSDGADSGDLGSCGMGDIGIGVNTKTGTFEIPCQVGTRVIEISQGQADGRVTLGRAVAEVTAGETTTVRIDLTEVPEPYE